LHLSIIIHYFDKQIDQYLVKRVLLPFILSFIFLSGLRSNAQIELWGMTQAGGDSSKGVIFKTDEHGTNLQVMHSFAGGSDGDSPQGSLVFAPNGKIYGGANGGSTGFGLLFKYDLALSNLYG
jgi:hypothetical protein